MDREINHIINWMKEYADQAGMNGGVVGLSGGLDSSVVAYLIKEAYGENALGVLLPINNSVEAEEDALLVAKSSGVPYMGIELSDPFNVGFNQISESLGERWNKSTAQLVGANYQARLRMVTLYAIAQNNGQLVVGTGNSSELFTGYFTKYGDEGVDINPLMHYRKEEVKEMAKHLELPDRIINKAPSADLWEGQTDEKEMGVSYAAIDAYLRGEKVPEEDEKTILKLNRSTEHKRHLPPGPPRLRD